MAVRRDVQVSTTGELVVLQISGHAWSLHFSLALTLASLLLVEGRLARRAAGHHGRNVRMAGDLQDLEADKVPVSRFAASPPPQITEVSVRSRGEGVQMRLGAITAGLSWEAALQISQWLRVRGRQAAQSIGEQAHWADLGQLKRAHELAQEHRPVH